MASHMRISRAGLELIKQFEGYRPFDEELPDGRFIVGYGHVRAKKGDDRLSKAEAEALLREHDLAKYELLVENCVLAPLNQNEFDALVSFAFNIGAKPFVKSDVVAYLNSGNRLAAATAMDVWRKARIGGRIQIVDALVRRRAAEKALFLTSPGRMPSAASVLYRPVTEHAAPVKSPPKAREIIVERAKPELTDKKVEKTLPEQAAESLRKSIQDILNRDETGDEKPEPANDQSETDGASPEEIEAAIMDLAGHETEQGQVTKSMWPQREDMPSVDATPTPETEGDEDLPPPPYLERVVTQPERATPAPQVERDLDPASKLTLIDDTETPEPLKPRAGMDGIDETVRLQEPLVEADRDSQILSAAPYGVLSLLGAGIAGYGLADFLGLVSSGETVDSDLAVYLPPFLVLLGVLLFVVLGYYFIRTLFSKD
ncbi:MAG: lysozyme [Pseudomonadota bacterium]